MESDAEFDEVRQLISQKREGDAVIKVRSISSAATDPMVRVECLSLLKVVRDEDASSEVLGSLMADPPVNQSIRLQVAGALRNMDYPEEAYSLVKGMDQTDPVKRLECMCLQDMGEHESALEAIDSISRPIAFDSVLRSEVLSALGEHRKAIEVAEAHVKDLPGDFDARRVYVEALMLGGRDKDAVRFVRECLKDKTAASNALAAYAMRIAGKSKSAAGYATRAIKMDQFNVSAMETLGICLAEKGEYDKARIVAGAINEASPGNKAAINVLALCP